MKRFTYFMVTHLPYCFTKNKKNEWVVLNRDYKPLGFLSTEWIEYEKYPIGHEWPELTEEIIEKVAVFRNSERFYLYDDSCSPFNSELHWKYYCKKLFILSKVGINF